MIAAPYRFPPIFFTLTQHWKEVLLNYKALVVGSAMNHVRLYRNELTQLGHGNPVWEPNPDVLYDRIRIGDVGYFQNDQFIPLFNILPPNDLNRNCRLPFPQPNFEALDIPDNYPTTQSRNPLQAGVYALESSLTFSASVGVDR